MRDLTVDAQRSRRLFFLDDFNQTLARSGAAEAVHRAPSTCSEIASSSPRRPSPVPAVVLPSLTSPIRPSSPPRRWPLSADGGYGKLSDHFGIVTEVTAAAARHEVRVARRKAIYTGLTRT